MIVGGGGGVKGWGGGGDEIRGLRKGKGPPITTGMEFAVKCFDLQPHTHT